MTTQKGFSFRPSITGHYTELEEDFIHLDWDIAIGRDEIREFATRCSQNPSQVRSIPYRSYPTRRRRDKWFNQKTTEWCAWHIVPNIPGGKRRIDTNDPTCDLVGFGAIYIPIQMFKDYAKQETGECTDFKFSEWYYNSVDNKGIPLEWDIPIVHLNFSIKEALRGMDL